MTLREKNLQFVRSINLITDDEYERLKNLPDPDPIGFEDAPDSRQQEELAALVDSLTGRRDGGAV